MRYRFLEVNKQWFIWIEFWHCHSQWNISAFVNFSKKAGDFMMFYSIQWRRNVLFTLLYCFRGVMVLKNILRSNVFLPSVCWQQWLVQRQRCQQQSSHEFSFSLSCLLWAPAWFVWISVPLAPQSWITPERRRARGQSGAVKWPRAQRALAALQLLHILWGPYGWTKLQSWQEDRLWQLWRAEAR